MKQAGDDSSVLLDALIGAAAGAAAVWVMDRVDWAAYLREDAGARARTEAVRPGGMDPAHVVADKLAQATGSDWGRREENPAGKAIHYAIGIAPAVLYSVVRRRFPAVAAGNGTVFGLGVALLEDEVMNPALGLAAPPGAYPWQAHARSAVAHVAYGAALETALRVADRLTDPGRG